ncbi:MAG: YggS family pyridoxal phosphate-dependent enzyme [Chromatiaceae bacterium]|nr:MAG: YggS family pyridoxal phosphate-dependent enzyme [Chromatiaceae bacterium]
MPVDAPLHDAAAGLAAVSARIRAAETRWGRPPGSVHLLAVSKRQPAAAIAAAWAAGQAAFGESYVQEAIGKIDALAAHPIDWHFIGRIQRNKTREIAARFAWVHSLADVQHALRLGAQRPAGMPPLRCCVQVNLSGEASKAGLTAADLPAFFDACGGIAGIDVCGLMTLPEPAAELSVQRRPFAALRQLRNQLATPARPLPVLSMGMSDDLEAAIAEGATMVRVGTALFGPRAPA